MGAGGEAALQEPVWGGDPVAGLMLGLSPENLLQAPQTEAPPALPCAQGGNDFEIYADPRTVGHSVVSPQDTVQRCREIFFPETAREA